MAPEMYWVMRDTMSGVSCTAQGRGDRGQHGDEEDLLGSGLCPGHYILALLCLLSASCLWLKCPPTTVLDRVPGFLLKS